MSTIQATQDALDAQYESISTLRADIERTRRNITGLTEDLSNMEEELDNRRACVTDLLIALSGKATSRAAKTLVPPPDVPDDGKKRVSAEGRVVSIDDAMVELMKEMKAGEKYRGVTLVERTGIAPATVSIALKRLVGNGVSVEGVKRGTRYFLTGPVCDTSEYMGHQGSRDGTGEG